MTSCPKCHSQEVERSELVSILGTIQTFYCDKCVLVFWYDERGELHSMPLRQQIVTDD